MLPIAGKWWEQRTISDDLTLLYEPHVHPFLRCNVWHVRGRDHDLLVDTGLGVSSLAEAMGDLIDKPILAVATHVHYDHVGCLHEFDHRLMHAIEAPRMNGYDEFAWLRIDDFPAEFHAALTSPEYPEYLINARPRADFDPARYAVTSTTVTRSLDEGDILDLGDRHFEIMHLPGHSPGSLGLWEASTGTLFSGDAIYDGELLDELPDSSIADYITTMKRLREMPVSVVHGGHEPSFGRDRLREIVAGYLAVRDR